MKLGINQFAILQHGYNRGEIYVQHVNDIYGFGRGTRRSNPDYNRSQAILDKLVIRGFLKEKRANDRRPNIWWVLTEKGRQKVIAGFENQ